MWKLDKRKVVWVFVGISVVLFTIYIHITVPITLRNVYGYLPIQIPHASNIHVLLSINQSQEIKEDGQNYSTNQSERSPTYESLTKIGTISNNEKSLPWWDGGECICDTGGHCVPQIPSLETSLTPKLFRIKSTCGRRTSADGKGQKIISFSLFGDDPGYWIGLSETLSKVNIFYPGWKVWLYTNPRGRSGALCTLLQDHDNFRVCDVTNLPHPLHNISRVHPTMWRISPLGDPLVDVLLVRDSDYMFIEREKWAVQEWLNSGVMFHVMRDHSGHKTHILAGMWGARWDLQSTSKALRPPPTRKKLRELKNKMLKMGFKNLTPGLDQNILKTILWPEMVGFVVSHDSFFCNLFTSGWRPWPTQRVNGTFVGNARYRKKFSKARMDTECPLACRPPDHLDWLYC